VPISGSIENSLATVKGTQILNELSELMAQRARYVCEGDEFLFVRYAIFSSTAGTKWPSLKKFPESLGDATANVATSS
jgi:hypothetical protein